MLDAPRVLVVDDDPTILSVVSEALRDEGYQVERARNGAEALDRARHQLPHAIVLDLMMPVLDGWGFAEACHAEVRLKGIPIVIMSATNGLTEAAQRLHRLGIRAYLAKPFDLNVMLAVVERLVGSAPAHA